MKKFRKLIPALALLLVSAVLMSTASYAWFSMNTTVTATGMSVKAEVPTQLLIKGSAAGAVYKSAISFTSVDDSAKYQSNAALTRVPATAYKGRSESGTATLINTASEWKKLASEGSPYVKDDGTIQGGSQTSTWDTVNSSYFVAASANAWDTDHATGDYLKDTFTLKLVGEPGANASSQNVKVAIKATTTGTGLADSDGHRVSPIYQAVHIAFTDGTTLYEFDLGSGAVTYKGDGTEAYVDIAYTVLTPMTTNGQEVTYTLYIWYDGEDDQCRNSNAASIDQFTYDFTFTYGA